MRTTVPSSRSEYSHHHYHHHHLLKPEETKGQQRQQQLTRQRQSTRAVVVGVVVMAVCLWSCFTTWQRFILIKEARQQCIRSVGMRVSDESSSLAVPWSLLASTLASLEDDLHPRIPVLIGCFWPNSSLVLQANATLQRRHQEAKISDDVRNAGYFSALFRPDRVFVKSIEKVSLQTQRCLCTEP